MKRSIPRSLVVAIAMAAICTPAHAQFSRLLDSVKNRVEQKATEQVERVIDGDSAAGPQQGPARMLQIDAASDFVRGDRVLVHHDFTDSSIGTMPRGWHTNGSGQVVEVRQIGGRWLDMQENALFKLDPAVALPERFTIEFDLLPIADGVRDLGSLYFGFAHDNSVAQNREIAKVGLLFVRNDNFNISSKATQYSHHSEFDLRGYANRILPVAISVDGDQMRVYLDGRKIGDARLFRDNPSRHFFIDAPFQMRNGGRIAVGNLHVAAFSADSGGLASAP